MKALARDAHTLILDEPTAVLAPQETTELLAWLRSFADNGNAVVLITHKLREALAIADDVTVLRRGRVVRSGPSLEETVDSLSSALLGSEDGRHDPVRAEPAASASADKDRGVVASLRQVTIVDERGIPRVRNASLDVRAGEMLGIAAIEGSGQRELLRALAGRASTVQGTIALPLAVGFVPEDRHRDALVLDFSLTENVALAGAGARRGRVPWSAFRTTTASLISLFDVRGGDAGTRARALSGGNQQKLVLARELDGSPPSSWSRIRRADWTFARRSDVHDRLRAAAAGGSAVVVFSSDLDEVLSLATRVFAVHAGTVHECTRDRDAVGRAMLGRRVIGTASPQGHDADPARWRMLSLLAYGRAARHVALVRGERRVAAACRHVGRSRPAKRRG